MGKDGVMKRERGRECRCMGYFGEEKEEREGESGKERGGRSERDRDRAMWRSGG